MNDLISILLIVGEAVIGPIEVSPPPVTAAAVIECVEQDWRSIKFGYPPIPTCMNNVQAAIACQEAVQATGAVFYNANVMPADLPPGQRLARNQLDQGWWTADKAQRVWCIPTPTGYRK